MMDERRKLKRQHIMFYSRVFDRQNGAFLGYLGNLTPDGAMIISESEMEVQQEFQLRIDLPEDIYDKSILNLSALSAWCKRDIDPNFFNVGFSIQDVSTQDIAIIKQIIDDYGLDDLSFT
jgi:hypothetical protein